MAGVELAPWVETIAAKTAQATRIGEKRRFLSQINMRHKLSASPRKRKGSDEFEIGLATFA
jgi:hypothetical protein